MASDTPALDRLVERMLQTLTRGIAAVEEPPEPLVPSSGAEDVATFLRMADPERTSEFITRIVCAMTSIDNPTEAPDFAAMGDQIFLRRWESGLQEDATHHLTNLLFDVDQGVGQEAHKLLSTYLPDEAGAVLADLWRLAMRPGHFEEGSPYYELSDSPNELLNALSFLVTTVAVRLFMSRHGRELTLKWAEAAAQISPEDETGRDAL